MTEHLVKVNRGITGGETEGGKTNFADVVGFFRRNWKFLALLTVVLSAVAVTLVLLLPKQKQKQVVLTGLLSDELVAWTELAQLLQPLQEQIGQSAVERLDSEDFGEFGVDTTYDASNQLVNVVLRSHDEDSLIEATPSVVSFLEAELEERYGEELDESLNPGLVRVEREVEITRDALSRVDSSSEGVLLVRS